MVWIVWLSGSAAVCGNAAVCGFAAVRVWQCSSVRQCSNLRGCVQQCAAVHAAVCGSVCQCVPVRTTVCGSALYIYITQSHSKCIYWYALIGAVGKSLIYLAIQFTLTCADQ
jgi:hypothetical protein